MRNLLTYLFIFCLYALFSQNARIDSLQKALEKATVNDTDKLVTLNLLSYELQETGYTTPAIKYCEEALKLGGILLAEAKTPQNIRHIKLLISDVYTNLGLTYNSTADFPDALKNHLTALKLREEIHDMRGISNSYMNVGITYRKNSDDEHALKYYLAALKIQQQNNYTKHIAGSFHNIGVIYLMKGSYDTAMVYFNKAMTMNLKSGNKSWLANNYIALGYVSEDKGKLEESLKNYYEALRLMKEVDSKAGAALVYEDLASTYMKLKQYDQARSALQQCLELSLEAHSNDITKDAYLAISQLDTVEGKSKEALLHYKMFVAYQDSISNEQNTKEMVRSQMQYDFEKKETLRAVEQEKKDAIAATEKRKQQITLWAISGFGILILGFALFAWRSFMQKKRDNIEISRQKNIIEEKQKEILDSILYARRIQQSLLPSSNAIQKQLSRLRVV